MEQVTEETSATSSTLQARKRREIRSGRRRDDRISERLVGNDDPSQKCEVPYVKNSDITEQLQTQQVVARAMEKRFISVQREKEALKAEQNKTLLAKNRLELLCRELQKQNRALKEENLLRIKQEEEKRKEVSTKFHATLAEITSLMQQNAESNNKLRDENLSIQNQFKGICDQYELREKQLEKMAQQMKLESQLNDAKLAKAKLELQAQKEILERDKAELMAEVAMCHKKCQEHEKTEAALRAQINIYFEKYDEFQSVLTKSNQVYSSFKNEIEKMSKKIARLEKETASWKQKWENSHQCLLNVAAEKQVKDKEVLVQSKQLMQLQKLCRTLQAERTSLLQQLNAAGITPQKEGNGEVKDATVITKEASGSQGDSSKPNGVIESSKIKEKKMQTKRNDDKNSGMEVTAQDNSDISPPNSPTQREGSVNMTEISREATVLLTSLSAVVSEAVNLTSKSESEKISDNVPADVPDASLDHRDNNNEEVSSENKEEDVKLAVVTADISKLEISPLAIVPESSLESEIIGQKGETDLKVSEVTLDLLRIPPEQNEMEEVNAVGGFSTDSEKNEASDETGASSEENLLKEKFTQVESLQMAVNSMPENLQEIPPIRDANLPDAKGDFPPIVPSQKNINEKYSMGDSELASTSEPVDCVGEQVSKTQQKKSSPQGEQKKAKDGGRRRKRSHTGHL